VPSLLSNRFKGAFQIFGKTGGLDEIPTPSLLRSAPSPVKREGLPDGLVPLPSSRGKRVSFKPLLVWQGIEFKV
jgi:hypothetical protein